MVCDALSHAFGRCANAQAPEQKKEETERALIMKDSHSSYQSTRGRRRPALAVAVAVGVVSAMVLGGCGGQSAGTSADSTVTYAIQSDPGVLNPLANATGDGVQLAGLAYESLLVMQAGKDPAAGIAEKWESTTTTATFTLKDDVTCSDGSRLTASDVKASFDYVTKNSADSPYYGVYVPEGVEVTADDAAKSVSFKVSDAQSFLAEEVGQLPIVCSAGLSDPSKLDSQTFGTGPYRLDSMTAGQTYTYKRVESYKSGLADGVTIDQLPQTVTVNVVTDQSTAANMLMSGDLNLIKLTGSDQKRIDTSQYTATTGLSSPMNAFFNQNSDRATGSVEVRQAIAEALDRDSVATAITGGLGSTTKSLLSDSSSICAGTDSSDSIPESDTSDAESKLDDAGWTKGSDGTREKDGKKLTIKILYNSNAGSEVAAGVELIQQELDAIGIDAQLTPSDSYTDVIFSGGDWDICVCGISASTPAEWYGILSGDFVPDGGNWTYNDDQEYFSLAAEASQQAGEDSCPTWQKAEKQLFTNVTVYPIAASNEMYYSSGVTFDTDQGGNIIAKSLRMA